MIRRDLVHVLVLILLICGICVSISQFHTDGLSDAKLGWDAQSHKDYSKAIDYYSQAVNSNDLTNADLAVTYVHRALCFYHLNKYDESLQDYNAAILLKPDRLEGYIGRGLTNEAKGDFDGAVIDFTEVLRLHPDFPPAYYNRGFSYYILGRYHEALEDFLQSVRRQPLRTYGVLWLHIVRQKLGLPDVGEFQRNSERLDRGKWPWPVISLYLGRASLDETQLAARSPEPETQDSQRCECSFYSGEYQLMNRRLVDAQISFQNAAARCPVSFYEHAAAVAELKELAQKN